VAGGRCRKNIRDGTNSTNLFASPLYFMNCMYTRVHWWGGAGWGRERNVYAAGGVRQRKPKVKVRPVLLIHVRAREPKAKTYAHSEIFGLFVLLAEPASEFNFMRSWRAALDQGGIGRAGQGRGRLPPLGTKGPAIVATCARVEDLAPTRGERSRPYRPGRGLCSRIGGMGWVNGDRWSGWKIGTGPGPPRTTGSRWARGRASRKGGEKRRREKAARKGGEKRRLLLGSTAGERRKASRGCS
jgi:hypothetical protein